MARCNVKPKINGYFQIEYFLRLKLNTITIIK